MSDFRIRNSSVAIPPTVNVSFCQWAASTSGEMLNIGSQISLRVQMLKVISESNSKFLLDSTLQFQMIDYLCSISWPKIFPLSVNKLRLTLFHQVIPFSAEKSSAEPFLPQMAVIMVPSK